MVNTRQRNKSTHPGLVDLDKESNRRQVSTAEAKTRLVKKSAAIQEIELFEATLLTEQQERSVKAREPPGPGVTKQPRTLSTRLTPSQRGSPNPNPLAMRYYGTYISC